MTTIVFDGEILASDSQAEMHGFKSLDNKKIHSVGRGVWIGCAGLHSYAVRLKQFLKTWNEENPRASFDDLHVPWIDPGTDLYCIMVDGRKIFKPTPIAYRLFGQYFCQVGPNQATGSGAKIANTLLHIGKDARYCVQVATELDADSGGQVQWVNPITGDGTLYTY